LSPSTTVEDVRTAGSALETEQITRPRARYVAEQIRYECSLAGQKCSLRRAKKLIGMLRRAAAHAREVDYGTAYRLREWELWFLHPVLNLIMPDDVEIPKAGSAHEMLQRLILDGREFALVHTREGADHCVVAIRTQSV
jgi:hypothetical protein